MGKLSKLILGSALAGLTAATVYFYLDETMKESVCDADDPEGDAPDNTEALKRAASRTYTMIKDGTDEAFVRVREAIGPKGNEVMDVAVDTASKVKSVFSDTAGKVRDILQEEEDLTPEEAEAVEEAVAEEAEATIAAEEAEAAEAMEEAETEAAETAAKEADTAACAECAEESAPEAEEQKTSAE